MAGAHSEADKAGSDSRSESDCGRSDTGVARYLVYTHLVAAVLCGLFSYWDTHRGSVEIPPVLDFIIAAVGACAFFTFGFYPLLVILVLVLRWVRGVDALLLVVLEFLILCGQFIAIWPAVS